MIFSVGTIPLAGCRRGLVADQFKFHDDDWVWGFPVVSGRHRGGAPLFSAAAGGLGGLHLLYLERFLDFPDVAATICADA